jgi:surface polysaccharide O-acyltransferase-like enzyme
MGTATNTPTRQRNYALDILRVVSILGVVAIHAYGEIAGDADLRGQPRWLAVAIIDIAFIWVVPVFVIISGTLTLAPRAHRGGALAFYRKRALRLLPALVFWHLAYIFVGRGLLLGQDLEPAAIAAAVFVTKLAPQLYFLWLILGLYLVAPLLARFLARVSLRTAALTTAGMLLLCLAIFSAQAVSIQLDLGWRYPWNALTQWFPYVGYFMAGWVLAQINLRKRYAALLGGAAVVLSAFNIWHWIHRESTPLLNILTPSSYVGLGVMAAALAIFTSAYHLLRGWQPPPAAAKTITALSNASFGVYLAHYLILLWLTFVIFDGGEPTLALITLKFLIAALGSFALSLAALRIPLIRTLM